MDGGPLSDIRDWGAFIRGRWNWTRGGYELGFPRGCQFTDVDAAVEFNGQRLLIETKSFDGLGEFPPLSKGQRMFLQDEVELGKTVLVLYGCGACNNPQGLYDVGRDEWYDWRSHELAERRERLKNHIDRAMGLLPSVVKEAA